MVQYEDIVERCMKRFNPAAVRMFQRALVLAVKYNVPLDARLLDALYVAYVFSRHYVLDFEIERDDVWSDEHPECWVDKDGYWSYSFSGF